MSTGVGVNTSDRPKIGRYRMKTRHIMMPAGYSVPAKFSEFLFSCLDCLSGLHHFANTDKSTPYKVSHSTDVLSAIQYNEIEIG